MVVALISDKDRRLREHLEAHLVGDLIDNGYDAMSASSEYGPKSFENTNEPDVLKKLHNSNVDAVITISLLDKSKETNYTPGNVTLQPYAVRYNRFWGYYQTYYDRIYTPGYYTTDTKYFFETNLYSLENRDNNLLYSVQSQAFDPSSVDNMADDYGKKIVKDMVKKGVLSKGRK